MISNAYIGKPRPVDSTNKGSSKMDKKCSYDIDQECDVVLTFPQRLMEVLENRTNMPIISWIRNGDCFVIHSKTDFEKDILPKYFNKQTKYSSFLRKLNRWGFSRVNRGPDTGAYYHEYFKSGNYALLRQMSCSNSKDRHAKSNKGPEIACKPRPVKSYTAKPEKLVQDTQSPMEATRKIVGFPVTPPSNTAASLYNSVVLRDSPVAASSRYLAHRIPDSLVQNPLSPTALRLLQMPCQLSHLLPQYPALVRSAPNGNPGMGIVACLQNQQLILNLLKQQRSAPADLRSFYY